MDGLDRWAGPRGELYVASQSVLFGLIAGGPWLGFSRAGWGGPWVAWPALCMLGLAGAAALGALLNLGTNLSALPHPKDNAQLVTGGLYACVRHPIYAAGLLGSLSWALYWGSWRAGLGTLLLLGLFDLKARREERFLAERFPDYAGYQKRVRRLIPWVY